MRLTAFFSSPAFGEHLNCFLHNDITVFASTIFLSITYSSIFKGMYLLSGYVNMVYG